MIRKTFLRILLPLLPLLLAAVATPVAAQDHSLPWPPSFLKAMEPMVDRKAATDKVVITRHSGTFNGRKLDYDAIVTETPVTNADGKDAAVVVTYAYVACGDDADPARPVLFIFNGGPGASSSPLHLQAFGPKRIVGDRLVNNTHSLLDVADLVFVDPPGTGASMPIEGADPDSLFSVAGDAAAVSSVADAWLKANGRTASPVSYLGESYGTVRALWMLSAQLQAGRNLPDGVALLAMALGETGGPVISDVVHFPTFAATAWYHGKVDRRGMDVDSYYAAALVFARETLAPALLKGASLPEEERRGVAAEMSRWIGLPADAIEAAGLRIDQDTFMFGLLADEGMRTGRLDSRVTRAIADSNMHPPFDDPSMTLGNGSSDILGRYLADELGYALPSPYRSLNLGINFRWNYGEKATFATMRSVPELVAALAAKPDLKVFTSGGYYDIATPAQAGLFVLDQAGVAPPVRESHVYRAGHSVFEDERELGRLSDDLRAWIRTL